MLALLSFVVATTSFCWYCFIFVVYATTFCWCCFLYFLSMFLRFVVVVTEIFALSCLLLLFGKYLELSGRMRWKKEEKGSENKYYHNTWTNTWNWLAHFYIISRGKQSHYLLGDILVRFGRLVIENWMVFSSNN